MAAWRAAPALLWAALIWLLSSLPAAVLPPLFPHADKLAHGAAYAVLGGCLALACPVATMAGAVRAVAIGTAYGASDEIHQYFVPGRTTEIGDVAADWLGVAGAVWLIRRRNEGRP